MPYLPNKPCATPGCRTLIPAGQRRCARHEQQQQREYNRHQRPDYHQFYNSSEWKNFRRWALGRLGYTCIDCGSTERIQLDHKVPIKDRPDLALELANVEPRCIRCHSRKTAKEDGRWESKTHG